MVSDGVRRRFYSAVIRRQSELRTKPRRGREEEEADSGSVVCASWTREKKSALSDFSGFPRAFYSDACPFDKTMIIRYTSGVQ